MQIETSNLLEHDKASLSVMVDIINKKIKEYESVIQTLELTLISSISLAESFEKNIRVEIAVKKHDLQRLYDWRVVFLNAWGYVSKRETIEAGCTAP